MIVALVDKDCTINTVLFLKIKLKYAFVLKVSERKRNIFFMLLPLGCMYILHQNKLCHAPDLNQKKLIHKC